MFVTSQQARSDWGESRFDPVRNRLITIPDTETDVFQALDYVEGQLQERPETSGVVILGNPVQVPSQAMFMVAPDVMRKFPDKRWSDDLDVWWIWSDHRYGRMRDAEREWLPVSRIPIVAEAGGLPWELPPKVEQEETRAGLHSPDFPFAAEVFARLFDNDAVMQVNPNLVADPQVLASTWLYLMLHGAPELQTPYFGRSVDPDEPVVFDMVDFGIRTASWPQGSTAFVGACWGALVSERARSAKNEGVTVTKDGTTSLALAMIDRGANAYVGFAGSHYFPGQVLEMTFGAPLHVAFWLYHRIFRLPASEALFRARHLAFLYAMSKAVDEVDKAIARKTFWSASCLGFGW